MSTFTAVGPRLGIFGPPPEPPSRSLLTTTGVLRDPEDFDGRWMNGVNLFSYPNPADATFWLPCDDDGSSPKTEEASLADATFDPVALYEKRVCSTISGEYEGKRDQAEQSLIAATPRLVEQLLVAGDGAGIGGNTNPFLGDGNVIVIAGGPYAPREGLALLEDEAARRYGAKYMIHATPGTVDLLSAILEEDDQGDIYTQAGTCVIPETGIVDAEANGNPPGSDTSQFVFASSPVWVWLTDPIVRDLVQSLDRETNTIEFIVERFALVVWDTLLQLAVEVDYALASS